MEIENRKIRYRLPVRIVDFKGDIENVETLLKEKDTQIYLVEYDVLKVKGEGYIILDFGEEIAGGIRILSNLGFNQAGKLMKLRLRFGESVAETCSEIGEKGATNDHALRDFYINIPHLSDECYGDTGFRFVRIDFYADSEAYHPIKSIYSREWFYDYKPVKQFKSDDKLLNKIYDTCLHTVTLCMQGRIWDGIKRDRLVWIGDMEPEIHAILHAYGDIEVIEKTIETAKLSNPMPNWINSIPSYSAWFLLIIYDIYKYKNDPKYVLKHLDYLNEIIKTFDRSLDENGNLDFMWSKDIYFLAMPYFIDWPTYREDNEKERIDANVLLLQYVFPKVLEMYEKSGQDTSIINHILAKLAKSDVSIPSTKVFAAFYQLVHKDDESYKVLIKDGVKGMSTFMSYYLLKAVAQKDKNKAVEMLKEYYGAMLSKGATSFWEDFNIEWLDGSSRIDELPKEGEKDLHGDFGGYCYVGYRHSLCHGWSSGPISFLFEEYNKK